ncbi:NTP transferase domain-containing protein, partial [Zoogloea sp.]|uniref:nucleotidyltransferase family protein n=1 Tax=Zoogloea sp. TaxID=49181 RepID=UPI002631D073
PLVAPVHEGKRGHPVGFAARWRSDLLASTGDQGARELLTRHGALLQGVPVSDPGVVRDIDVPADLAAPLVR